jgi:hypothetical protein
MKHLTAVTTAMITERIVAIGHAGRHHCSGMHQAKSVTPPADTLSFNTPPNCLESRRAVFHYSVSERMAVPALAPERAHRHLLIDEVAVSISSDEIAGARARAGYE